MEAVRRQTGTIHMNKKGAFKLESLLPITAALIIAVTLFACFRFYTVKLNPISDVLDINAKYTDIVLEMRADTLITAKAVVSENKVTLVNANKENISTYAITDGKLIRTDHSKKSEKVMIDKLKTGAFWTNVKLPNLLTVRLLPADTAEIPFFTSFALRGYKHE
jgi:hypothetical protein